MAGREEGARPSAAEETLGEVSVIPPYRVLLHNDDVTPMDYVVESLLRFFLNDQKRAVEVMMAAHHQGTALVAIMPLEYAEFKVQQAHDHARTAGFPLTYSIERAE